MWRWRGAAVLLHRICIRLLLCLGPPWLQSGRVKCGANVPISLGPGADTCFPPDESDDGQPPQAESETEKQKIKENWHLYAHGLQPTITIDATRLQA